MQLRSERIHALPFRIPFDVKRFDLRAQEMVWTTRAEFGQTGGVLRIDEAKDLFVVLDSSDKAPLLANLTAQPWQDRRKNFAALLFVERSVLGPAKRVCVCPSFLVFGLDVVGRLLDERQCQLVTFLVVIRPVDQTVLAQNHTFCARMLSANALKLETRPQPGGVDELLAVNLLRQLHRAP